MTPWLHNSIAKRYIPKFVIYALYLTGPCFQILEKCASLLQYPFMQEKPEISQPCAIVTGGSRGIGLKIANRLADQTELDVIICGRNAERLQESMHPRIHPIVCDVGCEDDVVRMFEQLESRGMTPTVLVNNAAVGVFKPLVDTTLEEWDAVQDVNVRGAFLCTREAMKRMRTTGGGRIINIGSVVSIKGYPQQAAYTASKHALLGLTKVTAVEGAASDIIAQIICPGGVDTEMARDARPDLDRSQLIQPDDVADAVMFCLQQQGNAITDIVQIRRRTSQPF